MAQQSQQEYIRIRLHSYTKKQIYSEVYKAVYCIPSVNLLNLFEEDINHYKKTFDDDKFEEYIGNKYPYYQPPRKKFRPIKNEKRTENLKLILSREGETDKFKAQFKSTLSNRKDSYTTTSSSTSACLSPPYTSTTFISAESTLSPPTINISSNTSSPVEESEKITKFSKPKSFNSKIRVKDPKTMMDEMKYKFFMSTFFDKKLPRITQVVGGKKFAPVNNTTSVKSTTPINSATPIKSTTPINSATPIRSTTPIKSAPTLIRGKLLLSEIECLYKKYFSKKVQDTIVVIANILNIISMSNKHHKARMDESFKKRTEAEKLKERCDANRMHTKHKNVLESELKTNFTDVITLFVDSEFEPAFQMFFLSILTVLRVLDQPKFKKGSIFKNLVLLLWNSLKNSNFEHPKVFAMFRSKSFRPDCIDLISLIEDSRDSDPEITDRMALFFVSTVNSREYFQKVIDVVTSDSSEDLEYLLVNASFQCRQYSKFKDPVAVHTSSVKKIGINKAPVTSVQNITRSDDGVQWVLAPKNIIQTIQLANENKVQKTASNTTVEHHPASGSSQPLNTYYETFSSTLLKRVSSESISPNMSAPKLSFVSSPSTSNGSFGQLVALRPKLQAIRPSMTNSIAKSDGSTIILGNKQFQLIRTAPLSQLRTVNTQGGSSIVIRAQPKPVDVIARCNAKDCKNLASIMCSTCTSVKYCNFACQKKDWYESHINDCDRLLSNRQTIQ